MSHERTSYITLEVRGKIKLYETHNKIWKIIIFSLSNLVCVWRIFVFQKPFIFYKPTALNYILIFFQVGLKPAGGIKTGQDAVNWLILVYTELGPEWLTPKLFRIGASSLLDKIIDELVL